ncbi:MAG: hypothetical protein PUB61_04830, partial [Bacteroidales bacterium]|nr:hypothetical protein [Bacteroidales bacterium]
SWVLIASATAPILSYAQTPAEPDSVRHSTLGEITVSATPATGTRVKADGTVEVDNLRAASLMQVFGEADAVRSLKMLPSITSTSDYASGMSVDGSDYSNTGYSVGGAPIFFPYHFGGIFSTFNSRYFTRTKMERTLVDADLPNRLGACVTLEPPTADEFRGYANVGLISSSVSVATPVGSRLSVAGACRVSYINALYGKLLSYNDTDIRYDFADYNLSATYRATSRDRLHVEFFHNGDHLKYGDSNYALDTQLEWKNTMALVEWKRDGESGRTWRQNAYVSRFASNLQFSMVALSIGLPSSIVRVGTVGHFRSADSRWTASYDLGYNDILPQNVSASGFVDEVDSSLRQRSFDGVVGGAYRRSFGDWRLTAWLKLSAFAADGYVSLIPLPGVTAQYSNRTGIYTLSLCQTAQTLHQVGLSDIGLASNFWLSSTRQIKPQRSASLLADYARDFAVGSCQCRLSVHGYYRHLNNAHEYTGNMLTMIDANYSPTANVATGNGDSVGASVLLSADVNRLSGWASYGYGASLLLYGEISPERVPSVYDAGHSACVFLKYAAGSHFEVSAYWQFNNGRRTTPVEDIYFIAGNVVTRQGQRNSARLPDYHRLDLSANYRFASGGKRSIKHMISVSLINAYARDNVELQYYHFDMSKYSYRLKQVHSLYKLMPSISYAIEI